MIQAIETVYNEYRFRSRLEARWAVFFDALDVEYEYEPEGYQLPSGGYLPDFWLPQLQCWIEIKAETPNSRELKLAAELSGETKHWVDIVYGQPGNQHVLAYRHYNIQTPHVCVMGLCNTCGLLAFGQINHESDSPCHVYGHCYNCNGGIVAWSTEDWRVARDDPRLLGAYRIARQARFEYGDEDRIEYEIQQLKQASGAA